MEKAIKFLIYSLAISILVLSLSIEKNRTLEIALGIAITAGFIFSYLAIAKICSSKNKKQNGNDNKEL
ncbi:hypothetical protein [Persephonella sp.]|uniref:hypothetical protein n=1 Tax=Persephonella sp. TaxID=2060922 RepID=UPI002606C795|nr:hypothetical protein [Persephonella sp.]